MKIFNQGMVFFLMILLGLISDTLCNPCQPNNRRRLAACYPFDGDITDHWKNNTGILNGEEEYSDESICGTSIHLNGATKITVDSFRNFEWGNRFGVSVWFKRTGRRSHFQGIVNSGYYDTGSWEIRMGREFGGAFLGAGVITTDSPVTWDYSGLKAAMNEWHHIAMSYNGDTGRLKIWLDGSLQEGNINCCTGPLVVRDSPLTIGQAGEGKSNEYFYGFIDELRVFRKILTASNARKLYKRPCGKSQ